MSIVSQLVQRADSWVNAMTGLGTLRDKLMHAQVTPGAKLTDAVLEAMFNDDDIARSVVTKLPREATRRGFEIELEGDDEGEDDETESADVNKEMQEIFAKLGLLPNLRDGWIWARLYGGGSGVFVGADDGRPVDQPLNEEGIRSITFFNLVKRPQLWIKQRYEDITAPEYGKPEIYTVNQSAGVSLAARTGIDVHESRLILFDGALTARMTMESPTGFDDSVLQVMMAPLQQTATAWQSIAHLMTDASQGVLKIANLVDLVAAGGQEALRSRIQLMDLARSVCRAILVDAEKESFERVSTSFAGLPEVLDKLMMRMASAAERPVTLLYGKSPDGMNATGESDIRGWYDTVAEAQSDELKPRLERAVRLLFASKDSPTKGRVPDNWCIKFNPLWQPTDKELAETRKLKADTYVALVGAQIMTDAEAGLAAAPDFPTIDVESREELQAADAEEGLRPREINTPEPVLDPNDPEGGGLAKSPKGPSPKPKGRSDSADVWRALRDDAQARVPKGSSEGGRWTKSGGGGGGGAGGGGGGGGEPAPGAPMTEGQRQALRQSFVTGKNAAVVALQNKLVARYGVPLKQASLLYERDIKAQMKVAKGLRAEQRLERQAIAGKKGFQAGQRVAKKALVDEGKKKAAAIDEGKKKAADQSKAKADRARERRRELRAKKTEKRLAEKKKIEDEALELSKKKGEADKLKQGAHPDVDAHAQALKAEYGDAARTVAWGRAMHDRGRALSVDHYIEGVKSLHDQGVLGFGAHDRIAVRDILRKHKPKTVGELVDRLKRDDSGNRDTLRRVGESIESAGAVVAHRRALEKDGATHAPDRTLANGTVVKSINLQELTVKHGSELFHPKTGKPVIDPTTKRQMRTGYVPHKDDITPDGVDTNLRDVRTGIEGARKHFVALAHKDIVQPEKFKFVADDRERAHARSHAMGQFEDTINTGAQLRGLGAAKHEKIMMHEIAHALESENPSRLASSIAYLKARTKGGVLKKYAAGDDHEMVWTDKFQDEYQGKRYVNSKGRQYATEVGSMAVQELSHGGDYARQYKKDRDTAHFALGFLANQ